MALRICFLLAVPREAASHVRCCGIMKGTIDADRAARLPHD
jgi:hypothetical protein